MHDDFALPTPRRPGASSLEVAASLFVAAIVVTVLYVGADLLVPLALAVLISFILAPVVVRLRRWGVPRIPAVVVAVSLAAVIVAGAGLLITSQLFELASNLPRYETTLRDKIRIIKESSEGNSVIDRTVQTLHDLDQEMRDGAGGTVGELRNGRIEATRPVPVEIRDTSSSPLQTISDLLTPVIAPIGTAGLVVVFALFILAQREDLRDRAIRLLGAQDIARTTQAIDDGGGRITRYLLAQLVVNVTYGIPFGIAMWAIGIPNPILWGVLATILRFIPFLGPFIAAGGPLLLAVAVDPGWSMVLMVGAFVVILELVSNNLIEPWLYGSSTGMSPVAIILAAVFWTTLWGPVGLLLATPLTVCLVVLGRHVPRLNFLDVMFGNSEVLTDEARIYQRLLASDAQEALLVAEEIAEAKGLDTLLDVTLVRVLARAENDRGRGMLDPDMRRRVALEIQEIAKTVAPDPPPEPPRVLCLGGPNELETAAATLLAVALTLRHVPAVAMDPRGTLPKDGVEKAVVVVFTSTPPGHVRRLQRRMAERVPTLPVDLWTIPLEPDAASGPTGEAQMPASGLRETVDRLAPEPRPAAA